ncbi:DsbA family protein [Hwanghaeella grinnelliae]|uniref:DsbA family protein n=1 Tax=Hwanghaeella grinnelliae TaxID=2500179 RepID=A0A437QU59_9PROT|nr:DsbA family protein [Hwanghaeella grinnelliae]RVU38054.1 DsbA family protein [Hwanghaeella grinnelliae]
MPILKPLLRATTVIAFLITGAGAFAQSSNDAAGLTEDQIRTIVRDYLLENPEVVIDAIKTYQAQQKLAEEAQTAQALAAKRDQIFEDPMAPTNGVTDADVTLVEFFDYQCGYCKKVFPDIMAVMEDDKKLRVVFKELPILGPESVIAARGAMAAQKQGKYMAYHQAVMDLRGKLSEQRILQAAAEAGLDVDLLVKDMESPEIDDYLRSNLQLAQEIGVTGTPAMFIGEQFIPGAIDRQTLIHLIAEERKAAGKAG